MIRYQIAKKEYFIDIAKLVHEKSKYPTSHCIQSSTGEDVESLIEEMEKWHKTGELAWAIAIDQSHVCVAIGCEFDRESGRGWLRGPFDDGANPEAVHKTYQLLMKKLPEGIHRLDTFLNLENTNGLVFYRELNFLEISRAHVYKALRIDRPPRKLQHCIHPLKVIHREAFAALHDACFPNTYYNGRQIIANLDEKHRVWTYQEGSELLGYINAVLEPWSKDGYVEFVGVAENARGKGIGRALLETALDWFYEDLELDQVSLTVSNDNINARNLYKRVGFTLEYTGVNQRLIRA